MTIRADHRPIQVMGRVGPTRRPREIGRVAGTGCFDSGMGAHLRAMTAPDAHPCPLSPLQHLPRVTAGLPGCGGRVRVEIDDFAVEETPLYLPCGSGEHLYLFIEKRDVSGPTLRRHVARALGISDRTIGMAGMKDRRAITRQWISVPASAEGRLEAIDDDRVRVLQHARHRNKLRTGHLAGNRFELRIRDVVPDALPRVQAKLAALAETGMPDFFGPQRMGQGGATMAAGWALSQGLDRLVRLRMPDGSVHQFNLRDRTLRRLAASALQSEVFNRTLARRLQEGSWRKVLPGDLCQKTDTGGQFPSDDPAREQGRLDRGELAITGPMWGPRMSMPAEDALALELEVLAASGLVREDFDRIASLAPGARRPLFVPLTDPQVRQDEQGLWVAFGLPPGAFATVLLHEIMGPVTDDATQDDEPGGDSEAPDDLDSVDTDGGPCV